MMTDKEYVITNFESFCSRSIGYSKIDNLVSYTRFLIKKYSPRPYHNFKHIAKGLKKIESIGYQSVKDLAQKYQIDLKYYDELFFSWMVHDIYNGCPEEVSLSGMFVLNIILNLGLDLNDEIVCTIIQETLIENALHDGPSMAGLSECDLIHDIDFMGIGDNYENFLIDDNNVEKELKNVFHFRERRTRFFHKLLEMKNIYRTKLFRKDYGQNAIDNIRRILKEKYS